MVLPVLSFTTLLDAAIIIASIFFFIQLFFKYKFSYWRKIGIPYVEPSVPFGNFKGILFQKECVGQFFRRLYEQGQGKPLLGFYIFTRPAIVLRDPKLIKQILVKDFNIFYDRYARSNEKTDPLSRNLFLLKGEPWKFLRNKISPTFTTFRLKQMFPLMENCGRQLAEHLTNASKSQKPVEMKETSGKYATDIITSCAFGIASNSLSDPKAEFRQFGRKIFEFSIYRSFELMSVWMLPPLVKFINVKLFSDKTTHFLRNAFWETMNTREEKNIVREDILQLLIQLKNKGEIEIDKNDKEIESNGIANGIVDMKENFEFNGDNLVAQAAIFFTAGFESNASTSSFTLYHLAMKPHLQTRLREEILEVMAKENGKMSYEAIRDMEYLHMVVSETLRKYPPLPILDRVPNKDYVIPGSDIVIEKGTPVYVPLLGIHNDPEVFPEPDDYDPERFNAENMKERNPFMYLPFGDGPKYCIGKSFGLIAVKIGLVHVLSQFEVSPCPETPKCVELNPKAMILASKGGLPLKFTRLKQDIYSM